MVGLRPSHGCPFAIRALVTGLGENGIVLVEESTLGASQSLINGDWSWPVHGLRHAPEGDTSGWYVWTGDLSDDPGFFAPLHAAHLIDRCPEVRDLLELPPGSRFLIAPGHRDIWTDESLLDV